MTFSSLVVAILIAAALGTLVAALFIYIRQSARSHTWIFDVLFALLLIIAAYLRLVGIDWDESQHLHPDERFLTGVVASLHSVSGVGEYFDTATSSLNPNNRGAGFFVYGTLPVFIVRYAAEGLDWINSLQVQWGWIQAPQHSATGYDQIHIIGRALSALADLGVIALVYLIASRLFDKRVGLLAAAFSTLTVMQIQQSHFWTVDNFANFFTLLAVFFAVRIATHGRSTTPPRPFSVWDFVGFGLAFGMALASKINQPSVVAVQALMLPAAVAIRLWALPREQRQPHFARSFWLLVLAGGLSLLAFRVFQPYAFQGLGVGGWFGNLGTVWQQSQGLGLLERIKDLVLAFFGLNPHWVETMASLAAQVNGDADWPPSMQWARRPLWFGLQNIVGWGLGWPLALLCLGGMAWAGWRIYKGDWRNPLVILWGWGVFYFLSQSLGFNPTMRYFLPVYPVFIIFGAWAVVILWDLGAKAARKAPPWRVWARPAAAILGGVALLGAALWAWAFVQIYQQDVSRVAAARWIYETIPGPVTLVYQGDGAQWHQPIHVSYDKLITPDSPLFTNLAPSADGELTQIGFKYVLAPVTIALRKGAEEGSPVLTSAQVVDLEGLQAGQSTEIIFEIPAEFLADPSAQYELELRLPAGVGRLQVESIELRDSHLVDTPGFAVLAGPIELQMGESLPATFSPPTGMAADHVVINLRVLEPLFVSPVDVDVTIASVESGAALATVEARLDAGTNKGAVGTEQVITLPTPVPVQEGHSLSLEIMLESGVVNLQGAAVANESSWDDGLPLRMGGYDGFGGIYQGDLNFEMYWDEDSAKVERFLHTLDGAEYIFITSSRQWGSLPRLPERFPLVVAYYRALTGCPEGRTIEACFIDAQVGSVQSDYGFELVQVFENAPQLGPWKINDQAAEEAYSVYDHPKVLVFRKTANYDSQQWANLFAQIDLTQVVRLTPKQASGRIPPNLMLPAERLEQQRAGGTWSDIFDTDSWINSSPWVSAIVWYLALAALGIAVFPLVRWLLPGLKDGGYPLARLAALVLLAYLAWLGASLGLTFSRGWLLAFMLLLVLAGLAAGWLQRETLAAEWKTRRAYFLRIELLFFIFFFIMLLIRAANPDLWHPSYGGEKPMDFSYFNAVLKSSSFPPYDPWFSGGYINYYYYGFVLVGVWTKLLGVVPAVAYNLILPTLFAMLALGAYSLSWNLWSVWRAGKGKDSRVNAETVGLTAAIGVVLLGNLGSIGMLFVALARLGADGVYTGDSGLITQLGWIGRGLMRWLSGNSFPVGTGEWYWNPTRIIGTPSGETIPITEFPLFTFTYADLHAHMIALPVTVLGLAWSVSVVLSRAWNGLKSRWQALAGLAFGAIILGSLRPINTWDLPTYLAIALVAVGYSVWRYGAGAFGRRRRSAPSWLLAAGAMGLLALLSVVAYQPFAAWYRQGYSSVQLWTGGHTPSSSYFLHWGIFLFIIIAWLAWETREWMAATPLASLRKLEPHQVLLFSTGLSLIAAVVGLLFFGVHIAWLVLPLLIWVGLLFVRPGQDLSKRLILFLIGTALFLTLLVEVIVLKGDISRMNTVFKFYMQAWVLFAIGAALAFAWTLEALPRWLPAWRSVWRWGVGFLFVCGGFFVLYGVSAKMGDRMADNAPHTLDGLAYMSYSVYFDKDQRLDLVQDYEAIRWMQENVQGSPVIVEAHTGEYKWGSRFTINTGLPAVIGWNWHQRQQREFVPGNDIWGRVGEVENFYSTADLAAAQAFLQKYDVKYIIVGQLERAYYLPEGLDKFEAQDGVLWHAVYRADDTVIYEVFNATLAGE
ncbi:MAG: DUF2298 domain-containing protein [Anaerolineales bacterium]